MRTKRCTSGVSMVSNVGAGTGEALSVRCGGKGKGKEDEKERLCVTSRRGSQKRESVSSVHQGPGTDTFVLALHGAHGAGDNPRMVCVSNK